MNLSTEHRPPVSRRSWLIAALLLAFSVIWFSSLDYRKLIQPDEGRYAEIAREMVASGDWLTPRLNDLKYFEKPPLQYWMTAAAFKVFGEHAWTARLWPGLTGFLSILLLFFTAQRLFNRRVACYSALCLGSSLFTVLISHINTLDMGLSFFLQSALCCLLLANDARTNEAQRRRWMLWVWVALALAMLSKGLVSLVLCGATLVLYSLLTRDLTPWKRLELRRGLPLFLLLAAPWFVAVSWRNPEFFQFFFIHEHFERFLTKEHGRYQPAWYFFAVLLVGTLPWTSLNLHAWFIAWRRERAPLPAARETPPAAKGVRFQPQRLLVVWALLILGFFSASSSKLPSYILPMAPALALLTGIFLTEVRRRTLLVHLSLVLPISLAALYFAPQIANSADALTPLAMLRDYANWAALAAILWFLGSLLGLVLVWRKRLTQGLCSFACAGFIALMLITLGHETLARSNSAHDLAQTIKPLLPQGVAFYSVSMYEQTLPFYLQRTLTLVNYRDELGFGLDQEPSKGIATLAEFDKLWRSASTHGEDAFAVMGRSTYEELSAQSLPMQFVAADFRRVVVRLPQPSKTRATQA
ncbi:MAG: glycosyltransferase family 39 protein [Pseudomonadota bacterium]